MACSFALSLFLYCHPLFADNLASGRSLQLDALNSKTALILLDEKKLYALNLENGNAVLLTDSKMTWFAVDRLSQTALSATRDKDGTNLTLYRLVDDSMKPVAKTFIRLAVGELQSMKSNDGPTFLLSCCVLSPNNSAKSEIPFFCHFAIRSPHEGLLDETPVPGLSEISCLLACGTIGFAGDKQGTFAYAAGALPANLIATNNSVKLPQLNSGQNSLFLIVSKGKIKHAWPVPFPSPRGGRVIGFSDDCSQLLAQLFIGAGMFDQHDDGFKLIDLNTGKMTPWPLGDPYEVLTVDGTLKRAIVQAQYGMPTPNSPPDTPLPKPDPYTGSQTYRWQAQLIEQGKPAVKILQVDGGDIELAGTFIDGKFYATDGKTLATIDEMNRVTNTPIKLVK
jgi:hypothetical protein